jgi:5-methylcytosine-specific restriction endonuclease McrA
MPARALRPYAHDAASRRAVLDTRRAADPIRRLYKTKTWQWTSRSVRVRDPFCKIGLCVKRFGAPAASEVSDHIIPAREYIDQRGGDESAFFDESNLQGACKACHDAKTARECGFAGDHG